MEESTAPDTRQDMPPPSLLSQYWSFLSTRKKWWLTPILVFVLLFGLAYFVIDGSAMAPFIYALI
jgi:hypothetical protein